MQKQMLWHTFHEKNKQLELQHKLQLEHKFQVKLTFIIRKWLRNEKKTIETRKRNSKHLPLTHLSIYEPFSL